MKFLFVALYVAFALRARSKTDTAQQDSKAHFEEGLREDHEEEVVPDVGVAHRDFQVLWGALVKASHAIAADGDNGMVTLTWEDDKPSISKSDTPPEVGSSFVQMHPNTTYATLPVIRTWNRRDEAAGVFFAQSDLRESRQMFVEGLVDLGMTGFPEGGVQFTGVHFASGRARDFILANGTLRRNDNAVGDGTSGMSTHGYGVYTFPMEAASNPGWDKRRAAQIFDAADQYTGKKGSEGGTVFFTNEVPRSVRMPIDRDSYAYRGHGLEDGSYKAGLRYAGEGYVHGVGDTEWGEGKYGQASVPIIGYVDVQNGVFGGLESAGEYHSWP